MQEGTNLSNPHRTALGIACSEKVLEPGIDHETLGLEDKSLYESTYTRLVEARVTPDGRARATVVYKSIRGRGRGWPIHHREFAVHEGDTVIYTGECGPEGITWAIDPASTVPKMYRPRY